MRPRQYLSGMRNDFDPNSKTLGPNKKTMSAAQNYAALE